MKQLDDILSFYLSSNTNFALMITGEWGVGKTHYYKNIIQPLITKTSLYNDESIKYKPIHISLFGLNSIKDIQSEIFYAIHPILKNRFLKAGVSAGKGVSKILSKIYTSSIITDAALNIEIDKKDWIKNEELVICFDDLERKSSNLTIQDLIGYINMLVEFDNIKVIVITNENKIKEKHYHSFKEKVIGNTIEFVPDLQISYKNIVKEKFVGSQTYAEYLLDNQDFIADLFFSKSKNLRVLTFALTYYQRIFATVKLQIASEPILKENEEQILKNLLKFSICVAIEYKKGNITFSQKKSLDGNDVDINMLTLDNLLATSYSKQEIKTEKPYREIFIENHYKNDRYFYYQSIYNFITGGDILLQQDLHTELSRYYNVKEGKVSVADEALSKLSFPMIYQLSDKKHHQYLKIVLKSAELGMYDLSMYPTIFFHLLNFNNPLKLDVSKTLTKLKKGSKKAANRSVYQPFLEDYLGLGQDAAKHVVDLSRHILDLNLKLKAKNEIAKSNSLEEIYQKDISAFAYKLYDEKNEYSYMPLFSYFNPHKFYLFIIRNDNSKRRLIAKMFKSRYEDYCKYLTEEIDFLLKLKAKLQGKRKAYPIGIDSIVYNELYSVIEDAINKLSEVRQ